MTDRTAADYCKTCGQHWEEHEFGVPAPYCPALPLPKDPIPEAEIQVTVTHRATTEDPAGTVCWVIESHRRPDVRYFAGYFFNIDFDEAVRFVRQTDADKVLTQFASGKEYYSVRHKWL